MFVKIIVLLFCFYGSLVFADSRIDNGSFADLNGLLKEMKLLGELPQVEVNYSIRDFNGALEQKVYALSEIDLAREYCSVSVGLNKFARVGYPGNLNGRGGREILGSLNARQEKIKTQFVIFHELAHCRLYELKNVFIGWRGEQLNNYFVLSGLNEGKGNLYYALHESFADALAFIYVIRKNGFDKEVLDVLRGMMNVRDVGVSRDIEFGVHNTVGVFNFLLQDVSIDEILSLNDVDSVEKYALVIANKNVIGNYKKYSGKKEDLVNYDSFSRGVYLMLESILISRWIGESHIKNVSISFEGNRLYMIADKVSKSLVDFKKSGGVDGETGVKHYMAINNVFIKKKIDEFLLEDLNVHGLNILDLI